MKKKGKITSLLLAGALVVGLPYGATSAKKATTPKSVQVQYVALGDSLAAGQTPTGYIDSGYPDYISHNFKGPKYKLVDYDNFGFPGYTSVKLKNDILKSYKIRKEVKEATHITIDIGANDFLSILQTNPDPVLALGALKDVETNLNTILSAIDKINPKAKVYVMGYYNPFPSYPAELQQEIMPLLDAVNNTIKEVAVDNKDTFIPTKELVAKDYETYLPNPQDIHLSKVGYQAVAKEFWSKINK
jgi:lysophospholipase L1-like esterase